MAQILSTQMLGKQSDSAKAPVTSLKAGAKRCPGDSRCDANVLVTTCHSECGVTLQ